MRALLTATVMAVALFGCAAGTDDPSPAPPQQGPGVDPPAQTFSGVVETPEPRIVQISDRHDQLPVLEKNPLPAIPGK